MQNETIESFCDHGIGVRLDFEWWRDRYRHNISMVDQSGAVTPLLQSIEGNMEDDWPPSPPLQSLSIEQMPDLRTVALLVGMAGRSHWSASAEPANGKAKIMFDVACRYTPTGRFPRPAEKVGSSYLAISPLVSMWLSIQSDDAIVSGASGVVEMVPRVIAPAGTTRWRYAVCLRT